MKQLKLNLKPLQVKFDLFLKGVISTDVLSGEYTSVFMGRGTDFVGYREYMPTDDASMIDWKASVRTNKLLVRVLKEERNLDVLFLFDVSNSMLCSSTDKLKCEYSAELIATLAFAMMTSNDKVGLAMLNDKIVSLMLPESGSYSFHKLSRMITNPKNYGGEFDLGKCLNFIMNDNEIRPGTLLFIVSDFLGLKKGWEDSFKALSKKFIVNAIIVRDPVDMEIPHIKGIVAIADPYSKKNILVDSQKVAQIYSQIAREQLTYIKEFLHMLNIDSLELSTTKPFLNQILSFFRRLSASR